MTDAWRTNWQDEIRSRIHDLGFNDTYDFVLSKPGQSFGEMFRTLQGVKSRQDSPKLAFVQLKETFYVDAARQGKLREAFGEALVRCLQQFLRSGWSRGNRAHQRRIDARVHWPVPHFVPNSSFSHSDWSMIQDQVWKKLEELCPPDEWCPTDFSDTLIQSALYDTWPTGEYPKRIL
jgi:hypothetical protein